MAAGAGYAPAPADESANPRHDSWIVAIVGFCIFLGVYSTQTLLPSLQHLFGASEVQVSATVSATTAAVALAAPLVGLIADRWERRHLISAALFGLALFTLLSASASNLAELVAYRFATGLFVPFAYIGTMSYIAESRASRVGLTMARFVSGTVIGGFSGRAVSGLFAGASDWRLAFVVLGALTALGAIVTALRLPLTTRPATGTSTGFLVASYGAILKTPALIAVFATGFGTLFAQVAMFTYVNFHLSASPYDLGPAMLAGIFGVYLIGAIVTLPAGRAIDRFGYRRVFFAATATGMVGVLITLAAPLWAIIGGLAVSASGTFACQAAATTALGQAAGPARSQAAGLYVAFYYLGGSVGGALPGMFWHTGGWPACVMLVAASQILAMGIVATVWPSGGAAKLSPETSQAARL